MHLVIKGKKQVSLKNILDKEHVFLILYEKVGSMLKAFLPHTKVWGLRKITCVIKFQAELPKFFIEHYFALKKKKHSW